MKDNTPANKSVLVTGSSSGIGKAIAAYLAERGYTVLAAVRRDSAVEALKSLNVDSLHPLDLTRQDQIDDIADSIKKSIQKNDIPSLYAVVNAAGGGSLAPIELMDVTDFRQELEPGLWGRFHCFKGCSLYYASTMGRFFGLSHRDYSLFHM